MCDVLGEFWDSFYTKHTQGAIVKIPVINHKMSGNDWKACAKVFSMGYLKQNYLPIELAAPFLRHAIYGRRDGHHDLVENYFNYLPEVDRDLVAEARKSIEKVDYGDLLDVLQSLDIKTLPSNENFEKILQEIAHKELIQGHAFISECGIEVLKTDVRTKLGPNLEEKIKALQPNARKVLDMMKFAEEPPTSEHKTLMAHLKKYVKTCSKELLKKFVRYCTGALG